MPTRDVLIREVLLTDNLTLSIAAPDRETRKVLAAIHDGKDERLEFGAGELSVTATRTETAMTADQWHTLIAAARTVLVELEKAGKPLPEANLTAALGQRGFTRADVIAGVTLLRGEKVVARTDGVITDRTGTEHRAKRRLSPVSLSPRTPTPSTSTTANRPNMSVGNLIEHPERVDMGERLRAQAQAMPTASFDPGDVPAAKPTVKKDEKPAPLAVPEGAIAAAIGELVDVFACAGKVTMPLNDWQSALPRSVPMPDLPEGWTPAEVWRTATQRALNGTLRKDGDDITYVPAEKFVEAVMSRLTEVATTHPDFHVTATMVAATEDIAAMAPSGWDIAPLAQQAMDECVRRGVLVMVDGLARTKPAPEPEAPAPAPAGDTTSDAPDPKPEDTAPVAPASGQRTEGKAPAKSDTEDTAPVSNTALEKKVDVLTGEVRAIGARLHTLPAPPTKEQVMLADATPEARHLLEKILVQLKVKQRVAEEDNKGEQHFAMTRDDLKSRMPGRARRTATNPNPPDYRKHVLAALELGRAMGVIKYTEKWLGGSYVFITHVNVMSRAELDRRVQRVLDIRKARAEKQDAA